MRKNLGLALAGAALLVAPAAWAVPVTTTFSYTGSLQSFVAPEAGMYSITAFGAQGGPSGVAFGGDGAEAAGTFSLLANQVLSVLVGGAGGGSAGGGGSFVFSGSGAGATPFVVAGGGGGAGGFSDGANGQITPSGGTAGGGAAGGTGGTGGSGGSNAFNAGGGGGGFLGAGSNGSTSAAQFTGGGGGQAATAGGAGGASGMAGSSTFGSGGYGGGGGSSPGGVAGGGGGGYSGGGGGGGNNGGAGGGGSYLALGAINTTLLSGVQGGNGLVTIAELAPVVVPPPTSVPEPASLVVLGVSVAGLLSWRRRHGA